MLLQRELFLTIFYTINLPPLLVTKQGLMLTIILSIYQVSTAFKLENLSLELVTYKVSCYFKTETLAASLN